MKSKLNVVARLLGARDLYDCPWSKIRAEHVVGLMTKLAQDGGKSVERSGSGGFDDQLLFGRDEGCRKKRPGFPDSSRTRTICASQP